MYASWLRSLRQRLPRVNYLVIFTTVAVLIVVGSLLYSYRIVTRLAEKEERLVAFWADAYQFIATSDNCEAIFLSNNIIIRKPPIIHVPAIITDMQGIPVMNNLYVDAGSEREMSRLVERELARMRESGFPPIEVEYAPGKRHYVYYRETDELIQLRYYPYITFMLLAVFITIVAVNFNIAQRSRQNKLWAGLARETAHQLGTPLSGLIAWVELLRLKARDEDDHMVVAELEKDIHHLQVIADRFSKIGSEPDLVDHSVSQLLSQAVDYVRRRISSRKTQIVLHDDLPPAFMARISPPLFEWVIENLLKNAVDATAHREDGLITIEAHCKNGALIIDVSDNGKGIARHDLGSVFQPGFTTKKRGWGLGLSLSRRIIERFHGGKIFVKRTELNKGTTFRLVIPPAREAPFTPDKYVRKS
jgi:signal transduction histidine kinase